MLSIEQKNMINNINGIINIIRGSKDRYRISVCPNSLEHNIHIEIINLQKHKVIYNNMIALEELNAMSVIKALRNKFIAKGALVSRLYPSKNDNSIRYVKQGIFLDNLEMIITISSNLEKISAMKAHAYILKQATKLIQYKKLSN